ncbi:MarR family transcriptional regulator [Lactobacillus sp. ESL0731]|uniref:MarR family winged helix-turn-helix transcriptional regulator n=1 Tax=unclassified Lactobacillus TaxID=2620435 RepID=UPI0023F95CD3|nr:MULTISPECIES: MarR family transcriptional regulator [unclassified Lactobacillus]WEV50938.1 MarR family transcriptional regulator [Lactobacillus sp. ESL0700]WEV62069.1 MarR family transcriptional regulator [Lactobacillus sp. ESL0731]
MSDKLLNRLGPKIKIANTLIEKELNNHFASLFQNYSLTGAQISLLVYLYDSKGRTITQKEIADTFVLSHPTIRGIVKRLADNDFIQTAHLQSDQRQIVLTLSAAGFKLIDENITEIHAIMDKINGQIIAGLSIQDVKQLETFLNQIIANF